MRAARAGPVLRGQHFANEQILRGPVLAALSGPVKGQCRLVCRVSEPPFGVGCPFGEPLVAVHGHHAAWLNFTYCTPKHKSAR